MARILPSLGIDSLTSTKSLVNFSENAAFLINPTGRLAHSCRFDIDQVAVNSRQTSIVCTLGTSWKSEASLEKMIKCGMNILLLNLSMTPRETCKEVIANVRKIESSLNFSPVVAIAMDMTAAPVRTGFFEGNSYTEVELKEGTKVELTMNEEFQKKCTASKIFIDTKFFPQLIHSVRKGDRIHLDDGLISLIAKDFGFDYISCVVDEGGAIGSYKRVTLPRERLYHDSIQANYMKDLDFAAECEVDFVFTSFADNANMLALAKAHLPESIKIFAKIETRDAVRNLESLISHSDGIIIRRSDLAIHYTPEKIFKLQKYIIGHCNIAQKPVFVIEQLLESMCTKPRPTRAESSDVANAVLDGADGLILTMETSWGHFPFESLEVIDHICREAERAVFHENLRSELKMSQALRDHALTDILHVTGASAVEAASTCGASAILVITTKGTSAMTIAASRPPCPTIGITRDVSVARHCWAYRGLVPFLFTGETLEDWGEDMDIRINAALDSIRKAGIVKSKDNVVIVTSSLAYTRGSTNTMQIFSVPEEDEKKLKVVSSMLDLDSRMQSLASATSAFQSKMTKEQANEASDTDMPLEGMPKNFNRRPRFSVMLGSPSAKKEFFGVKDLHVPL